MIPQEQRVIIGKEIVDGLITPVEAGNKYGISRSAAQKYATDYRRANGLPVKSYQSINKDTTSIKIKRNASTFDLEDYQSMTKEQLIEELIKSKANEARAKKGYEVKGDGQTKEYIILKKENLK